MKARTVAGKMNDAGIAHQEAATCQRSRCPSCFDFESPANIWEAMIKSLKDTFTRVSGYFDTPSAENGIL